MGLLQSAWAWFFPQAPPSAAAAAGRSALLDRIAILALAIEWTFFGALHFTDTPATVLEVPAWVPWPYAVVIVSGVVEVATGLLILVPAMRRAIATLSLATLIVLIPAMYVILTEPHAVPAGADPLLRRVFVLGLAPNNIGLALCSLHLIRHYDARLIPVRPVPVASEAPP
jgi:uncharacterized membrane protein